MTNRPRLALIELPANNVTYDMVRAAFDRALAVTIAATGAEQWPVYAEVTLDAGDTAWHPGTTNRGYVCSRKTRLVYTQYQDGGVDFQHFYSEPTVAEWSLRARQAAGV
jgi:hypothetical protein